MRIYPIHTYMQYAPYIHTLYTKSLQPLHSFLWRTCLSHSRCTLSFELHIYIMTCLYQRCMYVQQITTHTYKRSSHIRRFTSPSIHITCTTYTDTYIKVDRTHTLKKTHMHVCMHAAIYNIYNNAQLQRYVDICIHTYIYTCMSNVNGQ